MESINGSDGRVVRAPDLKFRGRVFIPSDRASIKESSASLFSPNSRKNLSLGNFTYCTLYRMFKVQFMETQIPHPYWYITFSCNLLLFVVYKRVFKSFFFMSSLSLSNRRTFIHGFVLMCALQVMIFKLLL